MARENILLVVHQETNGWYRCKAGEGGGGGQGGVLAGGGGRGCAGGRLLSRQVMRVSE